MVTTPFIFVASTHSRYWNNRQPAFVDVEPDECSLDPARVEEAITPRKRAILTIFVIGYPCRLEALDEIADRDRLLLINDGARFASRSPGDRLVRMVIRA